MALSKHAEQRLQQRAIPPLLLYLLYRHGREEYQTRKSSKKGTTVLFFDSRARRRARKELLDLAQRFDKLADTFMVESTHTGAVITAGHLTRRINRR